MRLKSLTPMLSVLDLGQTMAFYTDRLGFRVRSAFGDPPIWCTLERDGVTIMFNQPSAAEMAALPRHTRDYLVLYFYPDDVAALHAAWSAAGLRVTNLRTTVYGMKEFELRDPDGIWLWFGQDTDEAATTHGD